MILFSGDQWEIFGQLVLALVLGAMVGLEREKRKKGAGLRTYALVSMAASLFVIISFGLFKKLTGLPGISFDPSRSINSVAVGVGFIGAGIIIYRHFHIEGITTAAGLWTAGAIGAAVGARFYATAIFAALLVLFVLSGMGSLEGKIFKKRRAEEDIEKF